MKSLPKRRTIEVESLVVQKLDEEGLSRQEIEYLLDISRRTFFRRKAMRKGQSKVRRDDQPC